MATEIWWAEKKKKEKMRLEMGTYTAIDFLERLAAGEVVSIRYRCDEHLRREIYCGVRAHLVGVKQSHVIEVLEAYLLL